VLPEPHEVVAQVRRTVLGDDRGTDDYHGYYRDVDDRDDFAGQLRRWWQP